VSADNEVALDERFASTRLFLAVAASAVFVSVLTATMINVLVPLIGARFGASAAEVGWVVTGYSLAYAVGVPLYGRISDFFGVRGVFSVGLAGFAVGGLICALAPSLTILVFGRVVQGIGGAVVPALDRFTGALYARGVAPDYLITLEVLGRRSGKTITLPLVMTVVGGERYLVSMLGEKANWVRNVRAAGGNVTIRHGRREQVRLDEVEPDQRAAVLKAYLDRAPNARTHLRVDKDAPLAEFERVSPGIPVFRVVAREQNISMPGDAVREPVR
jgi:deazaflavin-dependent oxidoreductase (nitroreductase family)